jgi:arylsulfatase A-like enzyme
VSITPQVIRVMALSVVACAWSGVAHGREVAASGPRRPNVVFLFSDQHRGQALGVAGNPQVRTPYLDRLASQGVYLPNTIANSPVCCPARATMLTGQYPHRHGVILNDLRLREERVTLAEILAEAGYATGFVGKWHLDGGYRLPGYIPPGPRRQGFQFWAANECNHHHFDSIYFRDDETPIPITRFEPYVWIDEAIRFVRENRERPFFLMVAFGPPHNPYKAPPEFTALYDPAKLIMRPNWREGVRLGSREDIANYYGAITCIDQNVGRLLKMLDTLDLTEDTIVLFTSDHGDMLGSQGEFLKNKPWDESIRVPGILRYPREIRAGQTRDVLFSHVDFAPTLLGLCGLAAPETMQGRDLSGALTGRTKESPPAVLLQIFKPTYAWGVEPWRGVRTQRYTYARWEDRPWVLYDLKNDPYERKNLVDDPSHASLQREMDALLAHEMKRVGDDWSFNVHKDYVMYRGPAVYDVREVAP